MKTWLVCAKSFFSLNNFFQFRPDAYAIELQILHCALKIQKKISKTQN